MQTCDYLDAVKARHSIASDYKLAQVLQITQSAVSNYRRGRTVMDVTTAARVAELLALSPLVVIADLEMERAKKPEVRRFWARYAAGIMLTLAAVAGGVAPSPAEAALHNQNYADPNIDSRISRRRKKTGPRLAKTAASAFSAMAACLTGARRAAAL